MPLGMRLKLGIGFTGAFYDNPVHSIKGAVKWSCIQRKQERDGGREGQAKQRQGGERGSGSK